MKKLMKEINEEINEKINEQLMIINVQPREARLQY